jgi:Na+-transporting NADH:ubiquinone oxidoreductase subunit NqrC
MKHQLKKIIEKHSEYVFFILPLSLFALIGFVALYFAIKFPTNVPVYGWITILVFSIIPLILIYGFVYGFTMSEKQQKAIDERQSTLTFNNEGITIEMKLFDKTCFVSWLSIDVITYYNFYVSGDFTEHYEGYKLYLNSSPIYTKYEKQWWLNKLFSKDSKSKLIDIKNDTKYFFEIQKNIEKYLKSKVNVDFSDPMKETLITSQTYQSKNKTTRMEKWKPNNKESEQIVFDKFNRNNIEEIKKTYR